MITSDKLTKIGKFYRTHALKGELNAMLDVDESFFDDNCPLIVEIDGIFVPFYTENIRTKGSESYLVKLEGIDSETEAGEMVNKDIYALKSDVEIFEEGGYAEDFISFRISDGQKIIGEITDIDLSTENALFIVENNASEKFLIPINEDLIESINEDDKIIFMSLPDGILDINQ